MKLFWTIAGVGLGIAVLLHNLDTIVFYAVICASILRGASFCP